MIPYQSFWIFLINITNSARINFIILTDRRKNELYRAMTIVKGKTEEGTVYFKKVRLIDVAQSILKMDDLDSARIVFFARPLVKV